MAITLHFDGQSTTVPFVGGRSVLEYAAEAGWHLDAKCGGHGTCGACNVLLGAGSYRIFEIDLALSSTQRREALACQTLVLEDGAEIFLPRKSLIAFEGARIVDEAILPPHEHDPRFPKGYGLAVDIGTTTVVAALLDLSTGKTIHRESLYNQQILKADDVISRISLCNEKEGLDELQSLVVEHTLNPLLRKLSRKAKISRDEIIHVALSGNTVMMHLFFGLSPLPIGTVPFTPPSRTFEMPAKDLGLCIHPEAVVEAIPAISGYVGGDIVSDLLVSNLPDRKGLAVLIDIGTNGEMVASLDGKMTACATAAGPAFEGAGLLHGMRAAARAIDTIEYNEQLDFKYTVIGDDPYPLGLCGSAIIDFIAEGFRCGLINFMGRYDIDLLKKQNRHTLVGDMHACILVPAEQSASGEAIIITEFDLAEILKAKAAVYAGLKTLLIELGKTVSEIDQLVLAGGFAKHIRLKNAVAIGLLPDLDLEKYEIIGNGSLAGAALALLNQETQKTALELIDRPQTISLNLTPHFTNLYQEALALPNLDEEDFPSVFQNL